MASPSYRWPRSADPSSSAASHGRHAGAAPGGDCRRRYRAAADREHAKSWEAGAVGVGCGLTGRGRAGGEAGVAGGGGGGGGCRGGPPEGGGAPRARRGGGVGGWGGGWGAGAVGCGGGGWGGWWGGVRVLG